MSRSYGDQQNAANLSQIGSPSRKAKSQGPDSRLSTSSSTSSSSGFQSILKWFKRSDKSPPKTKRKRATSAPKDNSAKDGGSGSSVGVVDNAKPGSSKSAGQLDNASVNGLSSSLSSSSCDSVFSTATTGFAFIRPSNYQSFEVAELRIAPAPETDTYRRRVQDREKTRLFELTLKKKYGLYGTSETLKSEIGPQLSVFKEPKPPSENNTPPQIVYSDLSLPILRKSDQNLKPDTSQNCISNRQSASATHFDLIQDCSNFRRTVSDFTFKEDLSKKTVHVKGKRKAPQPPTNSQRSSLQNFSPNTTLGRNTWKKRRAPPPPPIQIPNLEIFENLSPKLSPIEDRSYELLNDLEIEEIFVRNSLQPDMDRIRYYRAEPKSLTPQQKDQVIDAVIRNQSRDSEDLTTDTLRLEQGLLRSRKDDTHLRLDLSKAEVPSSPKPLSPRPWYKRPLSGTREHSSIPFKREVILKTVDKRRNKNSTENEDKLPEVSYVRQSKFGLFSRNKEPKKVDTEEMKRKSGIGIPNISELDREAKEIISQKNRESRMSPEESFLRPKEEITNEESEEENSRRKSTKELISKFEATVGPTRMSINTSFIGRTENFLGETKSSDTTVSLDNQLVSKNSPSASQKPDESASIIAAPDAKSEEQNLVGVWSCPYCTLQNPNWRILCEVCERIKPYENKRLTNVINGNNFGSSDSPKAVEVLKVDNENLDKKTEKVKKYFFPKLNGNTLSKSASETSVNGNLMGNNKKFYKMGCGSPKLGGIRGVFQRFSPDKVVLKPDDKLSNNPVIVPTLIQGPSSPKEEKKRNKSGTPDLEEVRYARLNRFKSQIEAPIMITDKNSLDREKQRLKDMIRAMNAKALAEKYPVVQKNLSFEENYEEALTQPVKNQEPQSSGAIKKNIVRPELHKYGKVSTSVQTTYAKSQTADLVSSINTVNFERRDLPNIDLLNCGRRETFDDNFDMEESTKLRNLKLTDQDKAKVNELAEQLQSFKGREEFKATLKFSEKTGTLAINKILRSLEMAIMEGQHELAATLAKDLAKMKVSLSVTRHKSRPQSGIDQDLNSFTVEMFVEDKKNPRGPLPVLISLETTVMGLKERVKTEYDYPITAQSWTFKGQNLLDDSKLLTDYGIKDSSCMIILTPTPVKELQKDMRNSPKLMNSKYFLAEADQFGVDDSDEENIFETVTETEKEDELGAVALEILNENKYGMTKPAWTCPLCTLINSSEKATCAACSKTRPNNFLIQKENFKLPIELKKFSLGEKIEKKDPPINNLKNNLSKGNLPCQSSKVFHVNITTNKEPLDIGKYYNRPVPGPSSSPNITKNKYRGVDNFNPKNIARVQGSQSSQIPVKVDPKNSRLDPDMNLHVELMKLNENKDVVENISPFECPICFQNCLPGNGVILRECLHSFCRECLSGTIEHCEEAQIKCPFMDNVYSCESILQEREIKALVTEQIYEKHLSRSIQLAENRIENAFHCKTPNCRGWCIYEDSVNTFKCPICKITNCLTCHVIHDGLNCKQYQDRMKSDCDTNIDARQTKEMLDVMVEKGEAMNCPTCQVILMKKWGCDWLKCSMCKTEICWVTRGPRWGPAGKGDISDGCKCGVFGKKCHPKCNYCH